MLFHAFIVARLERAEQAGLERAAVDAVERGHIVVDLDDDARDVVGLAVDVLAHDENAVAVARKPIVAIILHPAARFLGPGFGVVAKLLLAAGAAEHHRRRPHFADHDLAAVLHIISERAEVKMLFQAADMVLVRVRQQKPVDVGTTFGISLQPRAQFAHDVGRVIIVRIIRRAADVKVDH